MHWISKCWRYLRNLDRIEAMHDQLTACRAVLAVTMRERDHYEEALERVCYDLARLKAKDRQERQQHRFWLTRTIAAQKVSEN